MLITNKLHHINDQENGLQKQKGNRNKAKNKTK